MTFAPMLDISRDPRWGRTAEGPGEDPWLAVQFARAKVRGFQGPDLAADEPLAATAKHFVRLWAGDRRPRLRTGGYFGAHAARGSSAGV